MTIFTITHAFLDQEAEVIKSFYKKEEARSFAIEVINQKVLATDEEQAKVQTEEENGTLVLFTSWHTVKVTPNFVA